ncbi:Plancitoxin-1, partial [Trichinella murrelli]
MVIPGFPQKRQKGTCFCVKSNSITRTIYVYANNLPAAILNQYTELSNLVNGVDVRITLFLEQAKFMTKAAYAIANIQAFGKHSKPFADMYARVLRNKFAASIRVWAPSDTRSKSICDRQYQLRKIVSPMQLAGSQVSRQADSAKWALIDGKNTVCFTTNDYTATDKRTPGAAVCLENAGVYNAFRTAAFNLQCKLKFIYFRKFEFTGMAVNLDGNKKDAY